MRFRPAVPFPFRATLLAMALAGCKSVEFPPGSGNGVVAFDATPPTGTTLVDAPTWQVGDRFEFTRSGRDDLAVTVVAADESGYTLRSDDARVLLHYARDLAELGDEVPDSPAAATRKEPGDSSYHWPLWVGKRWTCHFLRKTPGRPALPLLVDYRCDAAEPITTPAGTFDCLRIWRRVRIAIPEARGELHSVAWYAPSVGFFVQRLENDTLWSLTRFQRH